MVDYSAAPLTLLALDYTTVSTSWTIPTGNYTTLRLLRNQSGYPETQEDGVILVESFTSTGIRSSFVDGATKTTEVPVQVSPLISGKFVHYSIWVRLSSNGSWVEAARNYCLLPKEHATKLTSVSSTSLVSMHDKVMNYLPRVFTSVSQSPLDEVDTTSDLYKFLKGFSFTLDEILTYADLIAPNPDIGTISPATLSAELSHVNVPSSTFGATKGQKNLITNSISLYQGKGSKSSLDAFTTLLTGYSTTVTDSPNLMLNTQVSSFNGGDNAAGNFDLGGWTTASTAVVTAASCTTTTATFTSNHPFVAGQVVTITGLKTVTGNTLNLSSVSIASASTTQFTVSGSFTASTASGTGVVTLTGVPSTYTYDKATAPALTASSSTGGPTSSISITSATATPTTGQSITGTNIASGTVTTTVSGSAGSFTLGLNQATTGNLSGTYTMGAFTDVPNDQPYALQYPGRLYIGDTNASLIAVCASKDVFSRGIPVTPGTSYDVNYYVKAPTSSGSGTSKAKVAWYDASGNQIGTVDGWSSYATVTRGWSQLTGSSFTAPVFRSLQPTSYVISSGTVTLTFGSAHGFQSGEIVYIYGFDTFNGYQTLTSVATNTISFATSAGNVSSTNLALVTVESKQKVAYAIPMIEIGGTLSMYLDLVQFTPTSSTSTTYYEARGIDIYLAPQKTNYIKNPSFEVKTGTTVSLSGAVGSTGLITYTSGSTHGLTTGQVVTITGFSTGYNVTKATITVTSTTQFTVKSTTTGTATGTGTLAFNDWVTSGGTWTQPTVTHPVYLANGTAAGQIAISTAATPVLTATTDTSMSVGQYYTFSIYMQATTGTPSNVKLVLTATDGTTTVTNSTLGITLGATWARSTVTLWVPSTLSTTATYLTATVTTAASISSTTIQFEGTQLEDGYFVTDYFDGSYTAAGAIWKNAANPNNSYSYIYPNKDVKLSLLKAQITDWVPYNTAYMVRTKFGVEFAGVA